MRGFTSTRLAAATSAVTNRFVTSTAMIVGAYTVANAAPAVTGARQVTVTHTQVGGVTDTLGTIIVVGKGLSGEALTETITPLSGTTATGTKWFASVTSVTGAGWVINTGNDTIVVGHTAASIVAVGGGVLRSVVVNTTAAGAVTIADSTGTLAVLKASIAENTYAYDIPWAGYLSVTLAAASDVTVVHTATIPTAYAMS
jgi:hypothetical protein